MPAMKPQRLRIRIRGAVQGVGFRPFVYRLADELRLSGSVGNDADGVIVDVEGPRGHIDELLRRIRDEHPAPAQLDEVESTRLDPTGARGFRIVASTRRSPPTAQVLPDLATCCSCLAELLDRHDRRARYAFTNCTHCGPRFSIVRSLPYDRPRTTMSEFTMCDDCRCEYETPLDRRFHAQPNACPDCGPQLALWDGQGAVLAERDAALLRAASEIRGGRIVAVKGLGGFHLMAAAHDGEAIARLRERKPRREKPLALMVRDVEQARALCELDEVDERVLRSPETPIVLLRRRRNDCVDDGVAPGNPYLGLMLPCTPLHHLLVREAGSPLVATSGNLADEPISTDEHEALSRLGHVADLFLVHDRPIARHVDDSIVWVLNGEPRVLRRARGFAPRPLLLQRRRPSILAVGAQLKNAVALSVDRQLFVSQHIGDMETAQAIEAFERVVADLVGLYAAKPAAIACDEHPDYFVSRWARRAVQGVAAEERFRGLPLIRVQHHHAHLAACLLEHEHVGEALGVCWDGSGYGSDATVWGGEFLLGSAAGFRRVATLRPFRLPGGETAVREPRRSALGLLHQLDGAAIAPPQPPAPLREFSDGERAVLTRMLDRGINAVSTTSCGRLFDGVAALLDLCQRASFEGQAAMRLEHVCDTAEGGTYPLPLAAAEPRQLDWRALLEALLGDLRRGEPAGIVSARFHNALVAAIVRVAREVGCATVALSGGCFQNRLLVERAGAALTESGFTVLTHRRVPPNDGGISAGQIAVAAARLESG